MRLKLLLTLTPLITLAAEPAPPIAAPLPGLELSPTLPRQASSHAVTIQDLLKLRRIGGLSISPDGRWVAFTLRQPDLAANGYRTALFVTETSGRGPLRNLGSLGPVQFDDPSYPVPIDPVWSQDSSGILYPMPEVDRSGQFGTRQVFRWSRDGGRPVQLTQSQTDVLYVVSLPDRPLLYSTLGKRPDLEALSRMYFDHGIWYFDLDSRPNSLGSISPSWTRRGTDILDQALHHMRMIYEPATGQWLDDVPYAVHTLDQSGKDRNATSEEAALYTKLAESHNIVADWRTSLSDSSRVWMSGPAGAEVSFEERSHNGIDHSTPSNLKGHLLIYAVSRDGSNVTQVSPSSDYSYSGCSYSAVARRFACIRENPQHPPEIVSFSSDASGERVLTDLNPEVRNWKLPTVELIEWTDSLGNPGFGYLYKPAGSNGGPYPTIVLPYYSATYDFTETAVVSNEYPTYAFTSRGYAVLRPDMRFYMVPNTSGPSKKLWMNDGSLSSILAGLDRLVNAGVTDRARVGIAGLSQGAKYASYAIAHSHAFAAASVPVTVPSPMNSGGAYYAFPQEARDMNNHDDQGRIVDGLARAHAEESQVSDWADAVSTPLLVDASDGEWVLSVQPAIALRTRDKPVEMVVFPDARHIKKWPRQILNDWELNLDWFDFWLRDSHDSDPEKREQYQRWEKLKTPPTQIGRKLVN